MIKIFPSFKPFFLSLSLPLTLGIGGQTMMMPSFSCKGIFQGEGVCKDCRKSSKKMKKSEDLSLLFVNRCKKRSLEEKKDMADLEHFHEIFTKETDYVKKKIQTLRKSLKELQSDYKNTDVAFEEDMLNKSQRPEENIFYKPFFTVLAIEKKYLSAILSLAVYCNFYESFPNTVELNEYRKKKETLEYILSWHHIVLEVKEKLKLKFCPKLQFLKQSFNTVEHSFKKYSEKLHDIMEKKQFLVNDYRKRIYSRIVEEIADKYMSNARILFLQDQAKSYVQEQAMLKKRKKIIGKLGFLFQRHRGLLQEALSSFSHPDHYKRFTLVLKKLIDLKNQKETLDCLMAYREDYKILAHKQLNFLSSGLKNASHLIYLFPLNQRKKKDVVKWFKNYFEDILKQKINHDKSYVPLRESLLNDYRLYYKEIQQFFPGTLMDFCLLRQKKIKLYSPDYTLVKGYSFQESPEDNRLSLDHLSEPEERFLNHNQEQQDESDLKPFETLEEWQDFFLQNDLSFRNASDLQKKDEESLDQEESMKENSLVSEEKVRGREEESPERGGEGEDCEESENSEEEDNFLNDDFYSFLFFRNY